MKYTHQDTAKIVGFKTWSETRKLITLLKIDAFMYCNLGLESTSSEKKKVKLISRKIYKAISIINPLFGYLLEAHMMEKDLTKAI